MKEISKKAIILLVISATIFFVTLLSYFYLNTKAIILSPDLTCEFREEVYLKDFIYKLDGTLKNNYKIDTTKVGIQQVKAVFQDSTGFYKVKKFNIEVKDVTPPTILINSEYTVSKGYSEKLEDKIFCADDTDDNVKCQITGNYNLEETGKYSLTISATDKSNNTETKDFILNVIESNSDKESPSDNKNFVSFEDIYKRYKKVNTLIGVDISKWQQDVDFEKLKESGVEFVILKIAGQKEIDGEIVMDPYFKTNIENAEKVGLKVGLYFYSYAKSQKEAKTQADYIIRNIKKYKIELPIAFDWENWDCYNDFNLSFNSLNNIAKIFIKELESKGYKSTLYSSEYYLENIWFSEDYDNIWLANYGKINYEGKYNIWQLCSDGKVDGIEENVDIDVLYLDE